MAKFIAGFMAFVVVSVLLFVLVQCSNAPKMTQSLLDRQQANNEHQVVDDVGSVNQGVPLPSEEGTYYRFDDDAWQSISFHGGQFAGGSKDGVLVSYVANRNVTLFDISDHVDKFLFCMVGDDERAEIVGKLFDIAELKEVMVDNQNDYPIYYYEQINDNPVGISNTDFGVDQDVNRYWVEFDISLLSSGHYYAVVVSSFAEGSYLLAVLRKQ